MLRSLFEILFPLFMKNRILARNNPSIELNKNITVQNPDINARQNIYYIV
jgi:hypothetical protein